MGNETELQGKPMQDALLMYSPLWETGTQTY